MKKIRIIVTLVVMYLLIPATGAQNKPASLKGNVEAVVNGKIYKTSKLSLGLCYAKYAAFIPDGFPKLRAIIIHQHGCGDACKDDWNGERNGVEKDLQDQAFAKKMGTCCDLPHFMSKNGFHN